MALEPIDPEKGYGTAERGVDRSCLNPSVSPKKVPVIV
jgi:hypothetical protein